MLINKYLKSISFSLWKFAGATHADELQYLFFPHLSKKLANKKLIEVGTDNYIIMEYFTQMWTDFAKTG